MKVVLTGGPSGGKTTVAATIQNEFTERVLTVPEAASMLFSGGFPRSPGIKNVSHRQKAIFYLQRELEGLCEDERPNVLLICDRGSLDGQAYWPDPNSSFLDAVGSNFEKELGRYDWVIHLDTAPKHFYDVSNLLRVETYEEAVILNEKVKVAWQDHQQRFVIHNSAHFVDKLYRATFVIEQILEGHKFLDIQKRLQMLQDRDVQK